jgi:hypothetical protein
MATMRHHIRIARSADDVWAVVSDPLALGSWHKGLDEVTGDSHTRTCRFFDGEATEQIITNDPALRRFQYRIIGGTFVPDNHLATVDVIEDGDDSLVIYSTDVSPDELAPVIDEALAGLVEALKEYLERA